MFYCIFINGSCRVGLTEPTIRPSQARLNGSCCAWHDRPEARPGHGPVRASGQHGLLTFVLGHACARLILPCFRPARLARPRCPGISEMKKWASGTKSRGRWTKYRGSNMMQWCSRMTSTLRPSLNNKLSFRLVDLTISFSIEHLAILSKLIHYIATCIANDAAKRNLDDTVPTSLTTTSFHASF
jgi:hypothetical protein